MEFTDYITAIIIPIFSIICGLVTKKFPPRKINSFYGYRTTKSMKNDENWQAAQKYMSVFFIKYSIASLTMGILLSAVCLIAFRRNYMPDAIMLIQAMGILFVFPAVEPKLKK